MEGAATAKGYCLPNKTSCTVHAMHVDEVFMLGQHTWSSQLVSHCLLPWAAPTGAHAHLMHALPGQHNFVKFCWCLLLGLHLQQRSTSAILLGEHCCGDGSTAYGV
jgi:hypothetical protein